MKTSSVFFERTESKVYFRKKKPLPDDNEQTDEPPARPHVKGRGKKKNDGRAGAIRARRAEPASRLKRTAAQRRRGNTPEGRKNAHAAG